MNLDFTEEQDMLRTAAKDFLTTECDKTMVRQLEEDEKGYSPELWKKMADLGWMGLIFPEKYGGTEMDFMSLIILCEEMGRNILPGPFFSTVVLCGNAILDSGTDVQKDEYLTKIASGDIIMSWVQTEPTNTWGAGGIEVKAVADKDDFVINGTKLFVADAHVADWMIVVTRTKGGAKPEDGVTLFLVDAKSPGITAIPQPTVGMDKLCEVNFKDVKVPKGNIIGKLDKGWEVVEKTLLKASTCKCIESVGAMQATVDMTNAYIKDRVQYGRPLAAFQVLQFDMANALIKTTTLRELTYRAAWEAGEGLPEAATDVAMAKSWMNDTFYWVVERGVQLHGAIGTTRDHDMGLYYRRSKCAECQFGDSDFLKEKIAKDIGL